MKELDLLTGSATCTVLMPKDDKCARASEQK